MYSYDDVMKLLEVQRESIMEFEAAKNKLILSSLIDKNNTMMDESKKLKEKNKCLDEKCRAALVELDELSKSIKSSDPDLDQLQVIVDAVEKWTPDAIHEAVLKIKTLADVGSRHSWGQWVKRIFGKGCGPELHFRQTREVYNIIRNLKPLDK
tara:strand:+ start:54 stop:512 length:459 start_codon:yes stop_codon:yes gene_type:complete